MADKPTKDIKKKKNKKRSVEILGVFVLASGGINHKQPKRISQFWIRRNSQCHSHSLLIC
jgi:hypothetical protein